MIGNDRSCAGRHFPPGPLEGTSSRRAVLRNLLVSTLLARCKGLSFDRAQGSGDSRPGSMVAGVPSLDELAGEWLPMNSLGSYPALNNFAGSLQVTDDLLAVRHLTFCPFSQAQDTGTLRINGAAVKAADSRWYAYQVLRRAKSDELEAESSVRMVHEGRGVLFRLELKNLRSAAQTPGVTAELAGLIGKYESKWDWELPWPKNENEFTAAKASGGNILLVRHTKSSARVAFAFVRQPDSLESIGSRGRATWKIPLYPGQNRTIEFVMAVGDGDDEAMQLAGKWVAEFENTFNSVRALWQERFHRMFTPGNGYFSGSLPVLVTPDEAVRRTYYMSVLSSVASLLRTNFSLQPRVDVTAAPQYAVTLTYFWDAAMVPTLTALLDPAMMRAQLKRWLGMNIYRCYAQDAFSGQGRGPWYSANDVSLFGMLQSYLQVTGDQDFLNEKAGEKTVAEHMQGLATHWKQLAGNHGLADYGGAENLLECVPTYVHRVASLNAANVGMMRAFSILLECRGDDAGAMQLRAEAKRLAAQVLSLYVPGQGVWNCLQPDGKLQEVRHVYDFIMTARWMPEDLSPAMRSEMHAFVERELLTKNWLRALSLKDPAASQSDRPDHGPMGAYDAWPALTLEAMGTLGFREQALEALHRFEEVTHEGPYSQSHELLGRDYDARARVTDRGLQTTNELCGGAFADVIVRAFFGFQPDFEGRNALVAPDVPRGFNGTLVGLRWRGRLYNLSSSARGLSMMKQ